LSSTIVLLVSIELTTFPEHYADLPACLNSMLIIPRTPSPPPLEERDITTLNHDELRELQKRALDFKVSDFQLTEQQPTKGAPEAAGGGSQDQAGEGRGQSASPQDRTSKCRRHTTRAR